MSTPPTMSCGGGSEYVPKRKLNSTNSSCATCVHSIDLGGGLNGTRMTECETEWTGLCRYLVSLPQHRLVSDIFTSIWLPVSVSHTRCASLFFLPHGLTGPPQEPFHTLLSHHYTRHLGHVSHRARRGSVERTREAKAKGFPLVFFLPLCVPHMLVCKSESSARKSILFG